MKTYLKPGDILTFVAPSGGVVSGTPVLINAALAIPAYSAAQGEEFEGSVVGVHTGLPKATGAAWAVGEALYWDNSAKNFTKTVGSNTKIGIAAAAAASGDTTGTVRLNGSF